MTNEPLHEMISAVVDGEASEFEYRRVLDGLRDPAVRGRVARQYALRAVMRKEADRLAPPALAAGIFAALDAEQQVAAGSFQRWRRPLTGAAVAATVCLATVLGTQWLMGGGNAADSRVAELPRGAVLPQGSQLGDLGRPAERPAASAGVVSGIGFGSALPVAAGAPVDPGTDANRLAEQRLQRYLFEHEHNAVLNGNQGMLPYARVVDYEQP